MEKVFDWSAPLLATASRLMQNFLDFLPLLIGAIAVLFLGWLVAKVLRSLTIKIANSFGRFTNILGLNKVAAAEPISEPVVMIVGNVVYWLVILLFLTSATNLIGLTMFSSWLDRLIGHLPNILSGVLIIFAGVVVGNLVKEAIHTAAKTMPSRQRSVLSRGAQIFTVATMIVIGIDQIGIDVTILITIIAIVVGALLGGIAIAFSLGSRTFVSNLIGARYLNKDYRVGELIQIDQTEGRILEISATAVILDTSEGRMSIPANMFSEKASLLLQQEEANVC